MRGEFVETCHWRGAHFQSWTTDADYPLTWQLRGEAVRAGPYADLNSHRMDRIHYLVGEVAGHVTPNFHGGLRDMLVRYRAGLLRQAREFNGAQMFNVYIVDSAHVPHSIDDQVERDTLGDCATVELLRLNQESEFDPYLDKADGIILWHHLQFGANLISRLSRTRIIVRNGVGYDNVDVAAAAARGIRVSNVPDYGTEEVADHAIALALALIRQIKPLIADVAQGNWEWRTALACRRVREQVFGVVGCGRIGTAAAIRAKALGFNTRFFDPYLASGYDKAIGVQRVTSLDGLLRESDVVSLHVPLNAETRHMMDTAQFRMMKKTAFLVNTARGGVVRHDAIVEALAGGEIAGAGLDVLENEPVGIEALSRFPNCIVTPHSAFYSQESLIEMRRKSALTVREALLNGQFINVVNEPVAVARR